MALESARLLPTVMRSVEHNFGVRVRRDMDEGGQGLLVRALDGKPVFAGLIVGGSSSSFEVFPKLGLTGEYPWLVNQLR